MKFHIAATTSIEKQNLWVEVLFKKKKKARYSHGPEMWISLHQFLSIFAPSVSIT